MSRAEAHHAWAPQGLRKPRYERRLLRVRGGRGGDGLGGGLRAVCDAGHKRGTAGAAPDNACRSMDAADPGSDFPSRSNDSTLSSTHLPLPSCSSRRKLVNAEGVVAAAAGPEVGVVVAAAAASAASATTAASASAAPRVAERERR